MSEYIERGALLLALGEKRAVLNGLSEYGYLQVIREVPAADVEPVVRGEWKADKKTFGVWNCSVCAETALCNGIEEEVKSAFCPHCGAKMNLN